MDENGILSQLRVITKILVLGITKDLSQKEQIQLLDKANLQPKEIAGLIGTTPNTVRVILTRIRKKTKKGEKR